nr:pseudaminic acid cytidylyltransferase [Phycobacter azelaicus]
MIPARGGSKRIPRKNIKLFGGIPMIGWPIETAREAGCFDRIIVSTDDVEIADVARDLGAEVPFMRPAELADDHATARQVIIHAITALEEQMGCRIDRVCTLYATAAFARAEDLHAARHALGQEGSEVDFIFAAAEYPHPVHRAMTQDSQGGVQMLFPEHRGTRTQDLPECFHDLGMFYWGHRDAFISGAAMFSPRSRPFMIPRTRAVDIDTPQDWALAEALFAALKDMQ